MMETYKISGVEVFSEGNWNGDDYTKKDLEEMVRAFNETKEGVRPYIKLGHADKQKLLQEDGMPAAGWIERLYIKGDKLLADFSDVPKKIFNLIQTKAYRKVSAEIFWNINVKDKKYSRMLGAVALLGANTPGVYNLSDILAMYSLDTQDVELKTYQDKALSFEVKKLTILNDKGEPMTKTENEIKLELELKAKQELADKQAEELKKFTADQDAKEKEIADLKKFKAEAEARELKLAQEAEQAKLAKFVTELEAEKLCTPSMKDAITQLLGPDKKEYSIQLNEKEEKLSKEQLLKETLKLFKAAAEVNFDESSKQGETKSKKNEEAEKILDEKAKKYAKEHNVNYGQALKVVQKEQ